ncbi:MAG: FAD-dependent monooxygenase [Hyphomicrobiaceae bacterium]
MQNDEPAATRPTGARIEAEVAVVGTGLAGLAAALALAAMGVRVALCGPRLDGPAMARDTRSTALFGPSLTLLDRIGVLDGIAREAVPLVGLRIIDATGRLLSAPEVLFEAHEVGRDAFGSNIENVALMRALTECADRAHGLRWAGSTVSQIAVCDRDVRLTLDDGREVACRLVVGADGAGSPSRRAAGIGTTGWSYPQVAIASRFAHERPHRGISTELHRRSGPLTTVPLPGSQSSLVWVETPVEAQRLMGLDASAFAHELEQCLGGVLGAVSDVGPRAAFPLTGVVADRLGARRVALVGEAGHRQPPIGAQGLNLGLRDVAWLADLVAGALARGHDPGGEDLLAAYDRCRRGDVASRLGVVDALNRSLFAGLMPLDLLRGAGLAALQAVGPLRRLFMREGMAPAGPLPALMRPLCETAACGSPGA